MNNKKSIKITGTLIAMHQDRVKGYESALVATSDEDLKVMFSHFMKISNQSKEDLTKEIKKLGGVVSTGDREGGKYFNAWVDVKTAMTENDSTKVLEACKKCEKIILEAYERTIKSKKDLSEEEGKLLNKQHEQLKANYDELNEAKESVMP